MRASNGASRAPATNGNRIPRRPRIPIRARIPSSSRAKANGAAGGSPVPEYALSPIRIERQARMIAVAPRLASSSGSSRTGRKIAERRTGDHFRKSCANAARPSRRSTTRQNDGPLAHLCPAITRLSQSDKIRNLISLGGGRNGCCGFLWRHNTKWDASLNRTFSVIGKNIAIFALLALLPGVSLAALSGGNVFEDSDGLPNFPISIPLPCLRWEDSFMLRACVILQAAVVHGAVASLNGKHARLLPSCLATGLRNFVPLFLSFCS